MMFHLRNCFYPHVKLKRLVFSLTMGWDWSTCHYHGSTKTSDYNWCKVCKDTFLVDAINHRVPCYLNYVLRPRMCIKIANIYWQNLENSIHLSCRVRWSFSLKCFRWRVVTWSWHLLTIIGFIRLVYVRCPVVERPWQSSIFRAN